MCRIVILLVSLGVVGAGVMTARGYYCRDPDTGKLYPVNASWPSTTFCGSYTCKIRKRNTTQTDITYLPWRVMNFTKDLKPNASTTFTAVKGNQATFNILNTMESVSYVTPTTDEPTTESNIEVEIENKVKSDILDVIHKKIINDDTVEFIKKHKQKCKNHKDENDRYLTEDEIKVLVDILHTIKKSDLIAFVEMYNLAQTVYNELEASPTEYATEVVYDYKMNDLSEDTKDKEEEKTPGKTSYWYEPLAVPANKHKGELDSKDNILPTLEEVSPSIEDKNIAVDNTNTNSITVAPNLDVSKTTDNSNIYGSALRKEDFRMLPYFYPISSFQRLSSYMNPHFQYVPNTKAANVAPEQQVQMQKIFQANLLQSILRNEARSTPSTSAPPIGQNTQSVPKLPPQIQPQTEILTSVLPSNAAQNILPFPDSQMHLLAGYKPHCKHEARHLQYMHAHPSWFNRIVKKPFQLDTKNHLLDPIQLYIPKEKTIAHLPYPLNNIDVTESIQRNKNSEPWTILNFMKGNQGPPYLKATYIAELPNTIELNPIIESSKNKDLPQNMRTKKLIGEEELLSTKSPILDALKNINSQKIQLTKKIRLEKVGNILKLHSLLRKKREAVETKKGETSNGEDVEEFEVYLARSTCDADTTPGFFRMGNLTEPFPACCPQRIGLDR